MCFDPVASNARLDDASLRSGLTVTDVLVVYVTDRKVNSATHKVASQVVDYKRAGKYHATFITPVSPREQ